MTTNLATRTSEEYTYAADTPRAFGPVLVATDGTESANAAFTAARLLARRVGSDVQVLAVLEPMPTLAPPPEMLVPPSDLDTCRVGHLVERVRNQLRSIAGERVRWSVEVKLGKPAAVIARVAKERRAGLIITGLSRHGLLERLLGGETALHVAQLADAPLLATASGLERLPRCVLFAVNFNSPRVQIPGSARALFEDASTVYCVHVKPRFDMLDEERTEWDRVYGVAAREALERVKTSLELPPHVHVEMITLKGNPAREILDFAEYAKAELIVTGRRRRGPLQRRLMGGMAMRVLRGATCSVLILPRAASRRRPRRLRGAR